MTDTPTLEDAELDEPKLEGDDLAEALRNCKIDWISTGDERTWGFTGAGTPERDGLIVELLEAHARAAEAGLSSSVIHLHVKGAAYAAEVSMWMEPEVKRALSEVAHIFHLMTLEGLI